MLNNDLNINDLLVNKKGNFRFEIGNQRYEVKKATTDGEVLIYGITGAAIICAFAPTMIPATIAWSGLLGSLYGIATIISKDKK